MADWMTYYETGSISKGTIKFHKTHHSSRKAAINKAATLSRKHKYGVSVMRNGIEVTECKRGKCEK